MEKKKFKRGDHVRVISGKLKDETGIITDIFYSEEEVTEIEVCFESINRTFNFYPKNLEKVAVSQKVYKVHVSYNFKDYKGNTGFADIYAKYDFTASGLERIRKQICSHNNYSTVAILNITKLREI